ncbi:unnamed protein product [Lupinus luteus]|uniref:pectinesterase n=1 Tax=Lupinus luteus TaxID=3873 RepID=A0AAV1XIY0_LUPLU
MFVLDWQNLYNLKNGVPGTLYKSREVVPALAARIYGDKYAVLDCKFVGYQYTLWDIEGRHYYKDCTIEGVVDFIFGYGQSYFENCILNATSSGYVTAHGRNEKKESSGFVFKGGRVIRNGKTMLGRAYGPFSRVIFYETYLSSGVAPQGWSAGKSKASSGTNFIEAGCKGPDADTSRRVPWSKKLDSSKLEKYTRQYFIDRDGWLSRISISI